MLTPNTLYNQRGGMSKVVVVENCDCDQEESDALQVNSMIKRALSPSKKYPYSHSSGKLEKED